MKSAKEAEHTWRVGDICTCEYNGLAGGLLYVVIEVIESDEGPNHQVTIEPTWGFFQSTEHRKKRTLSSYWCTPRSLVDLGHEYVALGNFISNLVQQKSE